MAVDGKAADHNQFYIWALAVCPIKKIPFNSRGSVYGSTFPLPVI
jgi:hypothetical protein